jgi:hypothetical protein
LIGDFNTVQTRREAGFLFDGIQPVHVPGKILKLPG